MATRLKLLWRMATCGFGVKSNIFEFGLEFILKTAESQLLVYFVVWPLFPVQGTERSTGRNH